MSKKKHAVMCCSTNSFAMMPLVKGTEELHHFVPDSLEYEDFHFLNRKLVDSKAIDSPFGYLLGCNFPQVLPYTLIRCKGEYLSYERKGGESRLHTKHSIGIGGHIDVTDIQIENSSFEFDPLKTIQVAAQRENVEEACLNKCGNIKWILLSNKDEVGLVHAGFISIIDIDDKSEVKPQDELINAKWKSLSELKSEQDLYEDWSSKLIGWLNVHIIA